MLAANVIGALVILVALVTFVNGVFASPPPPRKKLADVRPSITVKLERQQYVQWELGSNSAIGRRTQSEIGKQVFSAVQAVDVSTLDPKHRRNLTGSAVEASKQNSFALWSKKFEDAELNSTNGYATVVDESVFTDLRMVRGRAADELDLAGLVVGRIKVKEYDPLQLAHFLVGSGIIDANIHVKASVTGSYSKSEAGHWFSLHSEDPYWTSKRNHARYDFGIHIAKDGTIRLINSRYVGRLMKE